MKTEAHLRKQLFAGRVTRLTLLATVWFFHCPRAPGEPTYVYTPGKAAAAGVSYVVPDMLLWYSINGFYTNGPIPDVNEQVLNQFSWEPYLSALDNRIFLIGANTYADDGSFLNQRFVVTFQPVAGGSPKNADEFYADDGTPFREQINLSRQNGNPQRIAGDQRPGATNFLVMAETSCGQLPAFQGSPDRWTNNPMYQADNRYATEQVFSLNPASLSQAPLTRAWDYVYGPFITDQMNFSAPPQLTRTGDTAVGLDDGNFAVVIDDRTGYASPAREVATFSIITPSGAVVKGPTLVDPQDIWDNVCAYRGGFAVRCHQTLYFFDNAGNLKFVTDTIASSGLPFFSGRGDQSRIASHIGSRYVYLVGAASSDTFSLQAPCCMAVWDSQTGLCVATNMVSDTDPSIHSLDRANLAVDAADRFCVTYNINPDVNVWSASQVVARIGKFESGQIKWITPSFFPFVNSENDPSTVLGFSTITPSVAMTTEYICISAKGTVNTTNNPNGGPDALPETGLYTVITVRPRLLSTPSSQTVQAGSAVMFKAEATGALPLSFQWLVNGTNLIGETNSVLSLTDVQVSAAGPYAVRVSNEFGVVVSSNAVLAVNRPPTAADLAAATLQDESLNISLDKLLALGNDPDGDPMTIAGVSAISTNGGSVLLSSNQLTYSPPLGYHGLDRFSYTLSDGRGGSASAFVYIQVRENNQLSANLLPITPIPGGYLVGFAGIPGRTYRVQRAPTSTGPWTTLASITVQLNGFGTYQDTNPLPGAGFYRTTYP